MNQCGILVLGFLFFAVSMAFASVILPVFLRELVRLPSNARQKAYSYLSI
jgi:hypothetical protein